jgi:hypothetical protein
MKSRRHILLRHLHDAVQLLHNVAASTGCKHLYKLSCVFLYLCIFLLQFNENGIIYTLCWTLYSYCLLLFFTCDSHKQKRLVKHKKYLMKITDILKMSC